MWSSDGVSELNTEARMDCASSPTAMISRRSSIWYRELYCADCASMFSTTVSSTAAHVRAAAPRTSEL